MEKIKEWREKRHMTQEELAKKSGISRVTISLLESGRQTVSKSSTLEAIAKALGVKVSVFFSSNR